MPLQKEERLDRTSSLQKYFICDECNKKFLTKRNLIKHDCKSFVKQVTCKWCSIKFKSKASLANHAKNVHGEICYSRISSMKSSAIMKCDVCSKMFAELIQLRYHIRRQHFNLRSKVPYWLQKKVNQVWFENVRNSSNVMEIRKAGPNVLVMRKLAAGTALRVADHETEEVDVSHLYPTGRKYEPVDCKLCGNRFDKWYIKKHIEEVHYNKMRHRCNKCNLRFKRLYVFMQHVCDAKRKLRGVKHSRKKDGIRITTCESLAL